MTAILAITGGVGGAKLALGLTQLLGPEELAFVANTGDDFTHLGLNICPDLDTLMYTLSGEANGLQGWGRRDETFQCLDALGQLGGEVWFKLGDRDLAVHLQRSQRLRQGATLSEVTQELMQALGVRHAVFPMSDEAIPTMVLTQGGDLSFQHYFVRDRCAPVVTGFRFANRETARVAPGLARWLTEHPVDGIVICPSNPYVSVDPVLAVPGMLDLLRRTTAPIIAVSPIIAGQAIKGPAAKMMAELHVPQDAVSVAKHYGDVLDGFVMDESDASLKAGVEALGILASTTQTLMVTLDDRMALARHCLDFIAHLNEIQNNVES